MFRILFALIVLLIVGAFVLVQLFLATFSAMTSEAPVARIEVSQTDEQRFDLAVVYANDASGAYQVAGDYFLMEAEVVTLKSWAKILGGAEKVRLTKLYGRYKDISNSGLPDCFAGSLYAGAAPCSVEYPLSDDQIDIKITPLKSLVSTVGELFLNISGAERTSFYSAAGVDMSDNQIVWVCMTEDALVMRDAERGCITGGTLN